MPIWSPDSTRLAITSSVSVELNSPNSYPDPGWPERGRRESVIVINVTDGSVVSTVTGLRDGVGLTWSPDGHQLAGHDNFRSLYIWNLDTGALIDSYLLPPYSVEILKYSPFSGRLMTGFNTTRTTARRPDSHFVPESTFAQSMFDGAIQFVAPAASPDRLQKILSQCVTDQDALTSGGAFIAASQYTAFMQWVNQLPSDVIPAACAADLQLITQAITGIKPSVQ